jgi:hypothetical protein
LQTRWINKDVDLERLSKRIEEFYQSKGFEVLVEHPKDAFKVVGMLRIGEKSRFSYVSISGNPNDFKVEFSGGQMGRTRFFVPLITMFGGGFLILDRLRAQEFYDKLETEFWVFVERAVDEATKS